MSDDLLAKEKEFHRLNRELELKTRDVMREVDSIIYSRVSSNTFSDVNRHSNLTMNDAKMIHAENTKLNGQSKTLLIKNPDIPIMENTDNIEISLRKDNTLGTKAIINLLKGKIDMLHKELQATQLEFNRKVTFMILL
jgi:U3 small nucleolar ribonucleoprotein component